MAGVSRLGWMGRSWEARPDGSCLVELAFTAQTADQIILSGQCSPSGLCRRGRHVDLVRLPAHAGWSRIVSGSAGFSRVADTKLGHELRKLPWSDIERHQPGNFTTCPMTSLARRSSGVGTRELWSACESSSWRSAGAQPYVGSISRKRRPFGREKTVTAVDALPPTPGTWRDTHRLVTARVGLLLIALTVLSPVIANRAAPGGTQDEIVVAASASANEPTSVPAVHDRSPLSADSGGSRATAYVVKTSTNGQPPVVAIAAIVVLASLTFTSRRTKALEILGLDAGTTAFFNAPTLAEFSTLASILATAVHALDSSDRLAVLEASTSSDARPHAQAHQMQAKTHVTPGWIALRRCALRDARAHGKARRHPAAFDRVIDAAHADHQAADPPAVQSLSPGQHDEVGGHSDPADTPAPGQSPHTPRSRASIPNCRVQCSRRCHNRAPNSVELWP